MKKSAQQADRCRHQPLNKEIPTTLVVVGRGGGGAAEEGGGGAPVFSEEKTSGVVS